MKRLILALSFTVLALPSAAQDAEALRIHLYVFAMDQSTEAVDPNLPAGEWNWEPFRWGPDGNTYSLDVDQAGEAAGPHLIQTAAEAPWGTSETVPLRRVRDGPWEVDVLDDGATHVDG